MDSLKIIGVVKNVTKREGQGQKGFWESVSLAIEEQGQQYPDGCSVDFFIKESTKEAKNVKEGDIVGAHFNMALREWDGRFFTNCRGWKISIISSSNVQTTTTPENNTQPEEDDDLPF